MASHTNVELPLPVLPQGWSAEKDFKAIKSLSAATQRCIEPVGPHFLAHARRARHKRTFSEDDRIQAQENVKKVEDDDDGEISEAEDPMMLSRDAKDWKVSFAPTNSHNKHPLTLPRIKTTTQSWAFPNIATKPPKSKSSALTGRRF